MEGTMQNNGSALVSPSSTAVDSDSQNGSIFINSSRFIDQLTQAEILKQFLFKEKVPMTDEQLKQIDLGDLNNLVYKDNGRTPTVTEWHALDEKHSALIACLDPQLRRKLRVRELDFFFGFVPMISLAACAIFTVIYMVYGRLIDPNGALAAFIFVMVLIVWTISQGALGACAFLGTSVLSTRTVEITTTKSAETKPAATDEIDITDPSILKIRILSGALFAFLIGLPFSFQALQAITNSLFGSLSERSVNPDVVVNTDGKLGLSQIGIIFVPFIIGFSTNFVLAVLNRILASLQILLGMTSRLQ
jgi:hypothetical protein